MFAKMTATIMGKIWEIWPVSSKQITAVETVCVTAPVIAAAPGRKQEYFKQVFLLFLNTIN